ncbi:DUF2573 family protein [Brevibacillus migulae]|uniref:DUF2573 family protein n=1 Tax=Brevibacillus migulae TaxID=1644114 RepID=UPI00106E5845|nr:DUF2573 family protein [Brevibacillus migulae]
MSEQPKTNIPELEGLLEKFTELLTGEATPERIDMVKNWCIYSHIQKVMPPLVQHWGSEPEHQQAKADIQKTIDQLKQWNQEKQKKE